MAISRILLEVLKHNAEFDDIKPIDSRQMLVLSLGTGAAKEPTNYYTARKTSEWGMLRWAFYRGRMPMLDVFLDASSDMVDFHVSAFFQSSYCKANYLRIQVPPRKNHIIINWINSTVSAFLYFHFLFLIECLNRWKLISFLWYLVTDFHRMTHWPVILQNLIIPLRRICKVLKK